MGAIMVTTESFPRRPHGVDLGVNLKALTKAPKKSLALRLLELLELWHRRWSDRRLLSGLDDRMLKDIGVSSIDALKESSKPFWLK
jgi:uncharacterized protein YjiS (DUF1127 family)